MSTISSWPVEQIDSFATVVLLATFALLSTTYNHLEVLCVLLIRSIAGMGTLAVVAANYEEFHLPVTIWLFLQSLCLDMAYLSFQTIFFERFIACFKIRGNVGFFIITIDFVGYMGTLALLVFKELHASHVDWTVFYNNMSVIIGVVCCLAFVGSLIYMLNASRRFRKDPDAFSLEDKEKASVKEEKANDSYLMTKTI